MDEIKVKDPKRRPIWVDTYTNPIDMVSRAVSDLQLERMARELLIWAGSEDAFAINEFYTAKHIPTSTWYSWLNKSDVLSTANDIAKEIIGIRNAKFVSQGKYKADMIKQVQGYYCPIWKSEHDRIMAMTHEEKSDRPQELTINYMPPTDVVPLLIKNE
jgi:hypothetical protein